MKALSRLRIILFALLIFGAFANFALNEWGNGIIILCQLALALSFLGQTFFHYGQRIKNAQLKYFNVFQVVLILSAWFFLPLIAILTHLGQDEFMHIEMLVFILLFVSLLIDSSVYYLRKKRGLGYYSGVFENHTLFICFIGFFFKNMHWPGASVLVPAGILLCALPFYLIKSIQFLKENYSKGKLMTCVLTLGSFTTVLLGTAILFKIMHYPFGNILFYSGEIFTLLMLLATLKWKYDFDGDRITIFKGLALFKTHIVPLYFAVFIVSSYGFLKMQGIAPDFYEALYPPVVKELSRTGKQSDAARANRIIDDYRNFVFHCEENGFLK